LIKVDAHQHFWIYDEEEFSWITDDMAVMRESFRPQELKPHLEAAGYHGTVAVQAPQTLGETSFLLHLADVFDEVLGVVGWVDLCSEQIEEQLETFIEHPRLCGVRHIVQGEPSGFLSRPDFRAGVALLEDRGLTYDILTFHHQLPEAIDFARAFPDQSFVLDHISKPDIKGGVLDPWRADFAELAKCDNVVCKLSGMSFEADWSTWSADTLRPYVDHALACFGPQRLMIGSDWPVCLPAGSYVETMKATESLISELSEDEQERILGGTAIEFYGLIV
jgi:L-fuconolactonase